MDFHDKLTIFAKHGLESPVKIYDALRLGVGRRDVALGTSYNWRKVIKSRTSIEVKPWDYRCNRQQ